MKKGQKKDKVQKQQHYAFCIEKKKQTHIKM